MSKFPMPQRHQQPAVSKPYVYPKGVVGRITVGLTHQEYFMEERCIGTHQDSMGLVLWKAYSVVREPNSGAHIGKLLGVMTHNKIEFIGMGLIIEEVEEPSWWDDRNKGLI